MSANIHLQFKTAQISIKKYQCGYRIATLGIN